MCPLICIDKNFIFFNQSNEGIDRRDARYRYRYIIALCILVRRQLVFESIIKFHRKIHGNLLDKERSIVINLNI
jgi:hypothetical protein